MDHKKQVRDEMIKLGENPETTDEILNTYYEFCKQNEKHPKKLARFIIGLIQQMNYIAVRDYGKYI